LRAGWRHALQTPQVDVLWRLTDEAGEPVLASPLVQQLEFMQGALRAADVREMRELAHQPVPRPRAQAAGLPVVSLSARAYDDLRNCPYRFFALRQLGLQEASEIDQDLDKRDFGNWVHEVLRRFHEALRDDPRAQALPRSDLMDRVAQEVTRALALPPEEFLPFQAAWPQVREGYLNELARFEATHGGRSHEAEADREVALGPVRLFGRIDRIDHLRDGQRMVMDYKTGSVAGIQARVKLPFEDTQLAFYAALLGDDTVRAAYVSVGERGETKFIEQPQVLAARDALVQGVLDDLRRIGEGERLQALGEGQACTYCAARGLCRKDFWAS
ncbi:MAG: RecB family exonuclease, partial [Ramlibacter sp.]